MKGNIKKIIILGFIVLLIIGIAWHEFEIKDRKYKAVYSMNDYKSENIEQIKDLDNNTQIEQNFICEYDDLGKIYILLNLNNTTDNEYYTLIKIKNENGDIITEKKVYSETLEKNSLVNVEFPKQKNSKGKEYKICISFNNVQGKSENFSINYSNKSILENRQLYINNEKQNGCIVFQDLYINYNNIIVFIIVIFVILVIMILLAYYIYKQTDLTTEKLYLYIMPIILIMFLIFMPTFKNHDEVFHYTRIYDITQGNLVTNMVHDRPGAYIPKNMFELIKDNSIEVGYEDIKKQFAYNCKEEQENVLVDMATTAVYSPVQYIPQALGAIISKITNNLGIMLYMARLFNLLFALVIIYFAIKIMPYGKNILLILSLLPISIEGFSSMSPDCITISVCFLFIAYILNLLENKNKKICIKDKILLFIMGIVIALCKIVYLPIVGLLLILQKDKYKNKKDQILTNIIIIGIPIILSLMWIYMASNYLAVYKNGETSLQLFSILQNPIEYIETLFYTINFKGIEYINSMLGIEIGWDEMIKLYSIVPITFLILLAFVSITDKDIKNVFNKYQKVIIILVILAVICLIFTSLYIQWTSVDSNIIEGIQGRYFIPIMPLVLLILGGSLKIYNNYNNETINKILGVSIVLLYSYIFIMMFINNI